MAITPLRFKVILNTCLLRIQNGETNIDKILNSYKELSLEDKKNLKRMIKAFNQKEK